MTAKSQSLQSFLFRHLLALLISLAVIATSSMAAPINYVFEGNGSGTVGTQSFTDADFSFIASGDTDEVDQIVSLPLDLAVHEDASGLLLIDGFAAAIVSVPVRVFNNRQIETIGIGADVQGDLIDIEDQVGVGLATYDLTTDFGPITTSDPFFSQFDDLPTDQGLVSFTSMSRVSFSATLIPEPATAVCLLVGCALGVVSRRRRS